MPQGEKPGGHSLRETMSVQRRVTASFQQPTRWAHTECAQEYPCRTRFDENLPGTGSFSRARRHEKTGQLIRNCEHVVPLQLFIVHNKLIIKEIKFTALNMG